MTTVVKAKLGTRELIIETGKLAKQADGAVTVRYGDTVVLVTAVASRQPREGLDFLPLTVEYQEKTYAAGKIPGGFFKREGRPSEKEILTARLIDRPIRPLFPKGFTNDIQIMAIALSHDGENDPDILAMVGASAALSISQIPFPGPTGSLRIGRSGSDFLVNPTYAQLEESDLNLIVTCAKDGIMMVESTARQVSGDVIMAALEFGCERLQAVIKLQEGLVGQCGRKKAEYPIKAVNEGLMKDIERRALSRIKEVCSIPDKDKRQEAAALLDEGLCAEVCSEGSEYTPADVKSAVCEIEQRVVRSNIIDRGVRADGRGFKDIREITCQAGILPRTHGSGLFTRGQTQSLTTVTLGTGEDEQMIDALQGEAYKSFMLHYNFPPFSVGETRPVRGPGRREIGHGALAEKSLKAVMPSKEEFPYTVRVVSEILESNGSSSMATVCASTLALMDAGVPIKAPVSGIAIGLVKEGERSAILTDIAGLEDHFGDMDFKVAGTKDGITALQMDIKIGGVTLGLLKDVLAQANQARAFVLDKMLSVISRPKESISEYAPRIVTMKIDKSKIGTVIGPGGKVIRKIIEDTGVTIDIEDDGTVNIASTSEEATNKAIEIIKGLTAEAEIGKIYKAKVKRIMNFGAFCEFLPDKEGLVHVSELSDKFVKKVEDVVRIGDEVTVKVIEVDEQGRVNLSMKQVKKR